MPKGKPATLEEMPIPELRDQMANFEKASLKITRRNEKGQIATVYSDVIKTLEELLDLDGWLKANAGGGRFRIEVRNPQDKSKYIVQPFHIGVEGAPRPPRFLGNPAHMGGASTAQYNQPTPVGDNVPPYNPNDSQGPGYGQVHRTPYYGQPDPYAPPPPAWLNGVHPSQRGGYISPGRASSQGQLAPGATIASDQIAMRQLQEQKAEAKAQIAKLEEQNKALLERLDRMADEAKKERETAREERHRMEIRALEARMEAMNKPAAEVKQTGPADMLAALAPFAPVLATMVSSNKEAASKSLEVQQQGLQSLMTATLGQSNKPDQTMEMFKSVIMPMMLAQQEQKSPAAQAQLFNSMVENNLNSVAMMAQLIEAFANTGGDEPWYLPMVRETMSGVVGMTEAYMSTKGGLPGQRPLPESAAPALPQGAPQQPGYAAYSTIDLDAPMPIEQVPVQPQAVQPQVATAAPEVAPMGGIEPPPEGDDPKNIAELESALLANASPVHRLMLQHLPEDFQTREWRIIVLALHQNDDVDEVAGLIAGHIAHLMNFRSLPPALHDIAVDPARALDRLLRPLPIVKSNPDFAQAVLRNVIVGLIDSGFLPAPPSIVDTVGEEVAKAAVAS